MDPILDIAQRHGLWTIEDCAQAHLARYKGRLVGTMGNAGSFSFYPGKNLGAMGDAGAIVTNDAALAARMARFARHGGLTKHEHSIEGINSRLDGLQAAILSVKLPYLSRWNAERAALASSYSELLAQESSLTLPKTARHNEHVFHLYVVKHEQREALSKHLNSDGIQTSINYPVALPFLPAYSRFKHSSLDFPNAYHNQSRVLSLPLYAEMNMNQLHAVVDSVHRFATGSGGGRA